ncbi:hypothetical protein JHK85_011108 [Glycine max]|nr:hypothetical protein JHK85_011108 [Glycine max]
MDTNTINGMKHVPLVHLTAGKLANEINTEQIVTLFRGRFVEDVQETALKHVSSFGASQNNFGATQEMELRKLIWVVNRIFRFPISREEIDHQKIENLTDATDESFRFGVTPGRNDMDVNQYVNNVKYITWILESVPREVLEDYKMTSMTLEFRCECTQSDLLESMSSPSVIGASNNDSVNTKPDLQYIYTCFVYKTLKPSWSKPEQNGILSKTQVMQGYELKTVDALDGQRNVEERKGTVQTFALFLCLLSMHSHGNFGKTCETHVKRFPRKNEQ